MKTTTQINQSANVSNKIRIKGNEMTILLGDNVVIKTNVRNYAYYYDLLKSQ